VGPTADVYALGVVLYEALSGVRPFRARTDADQAVLLATEGAMPLGERVPELAGARSDVVMRALARDPGDRYQSIAEMLRAFEGASARGWSARTRKLALACVVAIAIAAGVFGLASVWSTPHVEAGTATVAVTEPARPVSRPPEEAQRAPATPSPVSEPAPAAPPIVSRQVRRIVDRSANQNIRRPLEGPAPEHHDPATLLRREEF
jgi:serine/threonine-protein kinase